MVHISNIAHKRIEKVSDIIKEGDTVKVKVMGVDKEKNRMKKKNILNVMLIFISNLFSLMTVLKM